VPTKQLTYVLYIISFAPNPVLGIDITITGLTIAVVTTTRLAVATITTIASTSSPYLFVGDNTQKVVHKLNVVPSVYSLTFRVLQSCYRPLIDFFPLSAF
jgi:hypothetical protein